MRYVFPTEEPLYLPSLFLVFPPSKGYDEISELWIYPGAYLQLKEKSLRCRCFNRIYGNLAAVFCSLHGKSLSFLYLRRREAEPP